MARQRSSSSASSGGYHGSSAAAPSGHRGSSAPNESGYRGSGASTENGYRGSNATSSGSGHHGGSSAASDENRGSRSSADVHPRRGSNYSERQKPEESRPLERTQPVERPSRRSSEPLPDPRMNRNGGEYGGGRPQVAQNEQTDTSVFIVSNISETNLYDTGFFEKLFNGMDPFVSNMYTLTLINTAMAGHGGVGANVRAIVYGKMDRSSINLQDKIRIRGKMKRGELVVDTIYDESAGTHIHINRHWRHPAPGQMPGKSGGGGAFFPIALAVLIAFFVIFSLISTIQNGSPQLKETAIMTLAILFGIAAVVATRGRIFRSRTARMIMVLLLGYLVWTQVPGGEAAISQIIVLVAVGYAIFSVFR